ncbi:bifunctional proline dehydrogenase/L-glutamate gamma-semialdehyde dehydrogenase PutA [Noviherbaspirillum pedocola]|uniref:Bifunctional protein PutA n=1 Tax=Noviherbaspirillum pedocola TaxID=2801341 RepID=A0A934T471_9BURK|nr:bifunctional proline dehydrogenase/L-glutamate gamma-semialdehyde dehydrogenase PutA [Noviherbaspirillum pedocola]MBK4738833.1 bifunctional proline dehydrogenase/L-glutamate gamma-semialdehyde dehydrogenase PutA [Noviherbaspirillum pedocola]
MDAFRDPRTPLRNDILPEPAPLRRAIDAACRTNEAAALRPLLDARAEAPGARDLARRLVEAVRKKRSHAHGVDALMHEFSLSSQEGIALMCLAETLLRIPDEDTANRLIADKIVRGDWRSHLGSPSLFVNAAAWGLLISGKLLGQADAQSLPHALSRMITRGGEPLIRRGMDAAMRLLGRQFVAGRDIEEALAHAREREARGYRHSYDMLGEAALTMDDADRYCRAYEEAIEAIGRSVAGRGLHDGPGISVKLSALHPRYGRAQRVRVMRELLPRLRHLALMAAERGIGINIDAEESDRLELSLDLWQALVEDAALDGFDGLGFVVQAYQKRCPQVIDWLIDTARRRGRRFMLRLVKGAYWDAEIKRAQVDGMPGFPVFTRKRHTDVSYLACARRMLAGADVLYPQFATHNAHTLATVLDWARQAGVGAYEFQCLHGMGEALYDEIVGAPPLGVACRIYAPVGSHDTLLAYLVRRLLENGANSSFVNRIVDPRVSVEELLADPFAATISDGGAPHPDIAQPIDLYQPQRRNSGGIDLSSESALRAVHAAFDAAMATDWNAAPLLAMEAEPGGAQPVRNPANREDIVGCVHEPSERDVDAALCAARAWEADAAQRASVLRRAADLFEAHRHELMLLAIREAGKTLANALGEVREAADFLRYYAGMAEADDTAQALGIAVCISPWNFPLAIFTGQLAAALAAGNAVLAKPAEQTPLIAMRATQLLFEAGVPRTALQLLPGRGESVGARLVLDARVDAVLFTGSTEVAQGINRLLARRTVDEGREIALIAETGGQNALIADSTALPEQLVQDALASAFDSAGQRCSALRLLCVQEEIGETVVKMLKGAMRELVIGDPASLATDVGPVIDEDAQRALQGHVERMRAAGKAVHQADLPDACGAGSFFAPTLIEIDAVSELTQEVFGPVLHLLRYRHEDLPHLLDAIHATGYGLTMGVHSRIDATVEDIAGKAHVGNLYVNRNIIGAVVGAQPFGGEGKSGTGPKAGGPLYLKRLQRDGQWQGGAQSRPGFAPPFAELLAWCEAQGWAEVAERGNRYADITPLGRTLALPGPTGERNTLRFAPRGTVLCAAANVKTLAHMALAGLATGNAVLLAGAAARELPASLGFNIKQAHDIASVDAQLVLLDREHAPLRIALAQRDGALLPAIEVVEEADIPLWRLMVERALCVNTSAAGGNASLLALGE